jgi:peptidoglycan/xylan/chitin deacetylase (PgdA/CDA1 family)
MIIKKFFPFKPVVLGALIVAIVSGMKEPQLLSKTADYEKTVPVSGSVVEHVFFHPLIVYSSAAFRSENSKYMGNWFVTVQEFKAFLAEIYSRGFVLVSLRDIYESVDGTLRPKNVNLPANKKPLILSVDDLNYYKAMQSRGVAKRLVAQNGRLFSLVDSPVGEQLLEETEVVTIVDRFVKEHPDFSYNGAKGIIALTGYNGVFGYRTHKLKSPDYESERSQAVQVANYLKRSGWEFASHGYKHTYESQLTPEKLERDIQRWQDEVASIVGPVKVHIYPCGDFVRSDTPSYEVMKKSPYRFLFGVNVKTKWKSSGNIVYGDRIPIDGKYLMGNFSGSRHSQFCDISRIVDPKRVQVFGRAHPQQQQPAASPQKKKLML